MTRKSKKVLFIIVLLGAGAALGAWWKFRPAGKSDDPGWATATVTRRDLSSSVLATGAVKPQVGAEVRVGARISGKVEKLFANIGDVVKKGQVIAEIEKADLQTRVDQRRAELQLAEAKLGALRMLRPKEIARAEADVAQCQATALLKRQELDREEELLKHDVATRMVVDQAREQLAVGEAKLAAAQKTLELSQTGFQEDLKQAEASLAQAKAALENAKVELSYATITAPIAGVIGLVTTQEGETVAAGLSAPTFVTIVDLGRLQVDTFVDEVDIGKVQAGQKAVFTVDSFPSREFAGKVVAIYPKAVIQENVVNYDVVVEITDSYTGLLRPEMTASVTIQLDARKNVLTVPVKAVKRDRGKSVVYLLTDWQPQSHEVKVGWKDSQWVEIASGLEEGQTVLLDAPAMNKPREQ